MLTYAFRQLRANNYEQVAGEDFEEIYDLFAEILARGISCQLKQGLHKSYVGHQDSLTTLRGKLDINGTMRNFAACRRKLQCEYDVLTENNLFNQILKTAVGVLLKQSGVKSKRKSLLRKIMLPFENVDEITADRIRWNVLRYDRNSKTYRMLHSICYFILDRQLLTTEEGKYSMRTFSDEHMNLLFQNFVLNYYRRHHPSLKAEAKQIGWNINMELSDTTHLPIMQSDILLHIGERTLIIDTKYYSRTLATHFDRSTYHSANLYQIHTYVMNEDICHEGNVDGMLLYAQTQEETLPNEKIVTHDGNILMFKTLDLNQDFKKISAQLDSLIGYGL